MRVVLDLTEKKDGPKKCQGECDAGVIEGALYLHAKGILHPDAIPDNDIVFSLVWKFSSTGS